MTTDFIPLLAAVSAALIAGYFSFVTLINSKEQKTSEFRQIWIDSLRKEISEFTSSVYFLRFYEQQGGKKTDPEFINGLNKHVSSGTAILLRINANEKDEYLKVVNDAFLLALSDTLNTINAGQHDEAAKKCDILIEKAKPLLKEEWKRVKAGELSYRVIKYFSIVLFAGAVIYMVVALSSDSSKTIRQGAYGVSVAPEEKTNNSQNCTLFVSSEPSKPVRPKATQEKTKTCSDIGEK